MSEQNRNYYITPELLSYYLLDTLSTPRRFTEYVSCGLNELIDNNYVSVCESSKKTKNGYSLDLSNLHIDGIKQRYVEISSDEVAIIMNSIHPSKFIVFKYFVSLIGTINTSIEVYLDTMSKRNIIGNMTIEYLSKLTKINRKTVMAYNDILSEMGLIYIHRSNDAYLEDTSIKSMTNVYGRLENRAYIDEFVRNQQKYFNPINYVKINKGKANSKRSLSQKYKALCNGKEYSEEDIIEIYNYIVSENKKYEDMNSKGNSNYYDSKIRDIDIFEQFDFLKR